MPLSTGTRVTLRPTFRFAPSPNGGLHLGHAYSALLNQRLATRAGGRFLVRLEDIDVARCTPALEAAVLADLAWLGLDWEQPVRRQSEHFADYQTALDGLTARGLAYPCFCTRGEVARALADQANSIRDPDGSPLYPGTCRRLSEDERARRVAEGRPFALRLDGCAALAALGARPSWSEWGEGEVPETHPAHPEAWGDAVLRRRDVPTSYHLAVVVDDARQGVTDVVRGEDLRAATGLHRLLQDLLGLPAPAYHHHRLCRDHRGGKLSKSRGSETLAALRAAGVTAADVRRGLGFADRDPA